MSNATDVTDSTWDAAVTQSTTPVLVDFWAPWCGPCKAMGPWVDRLAQELQGRLKVVKLNTEDNPEVPSRYGITAIPTFLVIKNGNVVKQVVGQMAYDKLKAAVEPLLEPAAAAKDKQG
jgi:thioredoxin 1